MTTTSSQAVPPAARLRPSDLAGLASIGLRTRKLRAGLSALGIAIGVAAIVAVLGLAASSSAALLAEIQALGTNLLTVTNGQTIAGETAELAPAAPGMIARLPGVTDAEDAGSVGGVSAYKSPLVPSINTNALSVDAASLGLPAASGTSIAQGAFLNAATQREPVAVLGAETAQLLGIDRVRPDMRIWVSNQLSGGQWFYVTGILNPDTYVPQIDTAVLVGFPAAAGRRRGRRRCGRGAHDSRHAAHRGADGRPDARDGRHRGHPAHHGLGKHNPSADPHHVRP